jgi:hypothetical protein
VLPRSRGTCTAHVAIVSIVSIVCFNLIPSSIFHHVYRRQISTAALASHDGQRKSQLRICIGASTAPTCTNRAQEACSCFSSSRHNILAIPSQYWLLQ